MKAQLVRYTPGGATILLTPNWLERRLGAGELLVHVLETPGSWDVGMVIVPDPQSPPPRAIQRYYTHRYSGLVTGVHGALWYGSRGVVSRLARRVTEGLASWRARIFGWRPALAPAKLLRGSRSATAAR